MVSAKGSANDRAGDGADDAAVVDDADRLGSHRRGRARERARHVPAEEAGDERVGRPLPHVGRCADLFDAAGVHHDEAVGERERLVVVVGDEEGGELEPHEQRAQLGDEPLAQRPVERAQRFVEHEEPRLGRERARQRDALLLAARELADAPTLEPGESDQRERGSRARLDVGAGESLHPQPERHVPLHVAVGEQSVVLEHEPEAATVRRHASEVVPVPRDPAAGVGLEAGDGAEQRALAAPTGPEDAHDLAVGHVEVDPGDRDEVVVGDGEVGDASIRPPLEAAQRSGAEALDAQDRQRGQGHEDHARRHRAAEVERAGLSEQPVDQDRERGLVGPHDEDGGTELTQRDGEREPGRDQGGAGDDGEIDLAPDPPRVTRRGWPPRRGGAGRWRAAPGSSPAPRTAPRPAPARSAPTTRSPAGRAARDRGR